jgi:hypothetical protein
MISRCCCLGPFSQAPPIHSFLPSSAQSLNEKLTIWGAKSLFCAPQMKRGSRPFFTYENHRSPPNKRCWCSSLCLRGFCQLHELLELGIRTQIKLERVPNNKGPQFRTSRVHKGRLFVSVLYRGLKRVME